MSLVGETDAGAPDRALGLALASHAGVEQSELGHALGGELHDLDRKHAAQRQSRQREFLGRHLVDDPAGGARPAVPDGQRRLAPVGYDDVGPALEGSDLGRE